MYFIALATDYDGTLAHDGTVTTKTLAALERFKKTGRKMVLVTGRELPDLKRVFPDIGLFDKVVAENGALIYTPASEEERAIAPSPEPKFVVRLKKQGVKPLSVGQSIVATWEPHQTKVLEVIKELGLELEIIFNKGAVMILPSGINKATGLTAALQDLRLSPHNVVGVGDAENDHAFLQACGCSVAVDNAIPAVKTTADLVMRGARGKGVEELIDKLIKRDHEIVPRRHDGIVLGSAGGDEIYLSPTDTVLIAGSSGIGKSTLATALTERFVESGFQFCVFDPEGDYDGLEGAVRLGDGSSAPTKDQVLDLIAKADSNVVVNGLALRVNERPDFFADLLPGLSSFRRRTARPHWLVIDEAHHLLPKRRDDTRGSVIGIARHDLDHCPPGSDLNRRLAPGDGYHRAWPQGEGRREGLLPRDWHRAAKGNFLTQGRARVILATTETQETCHGQSHRATPVAQATQPQICRGAAR